MDEDRVAALERRVQQLEDERAVATLLASYGPLVDAGESVAAAQLWAVDGTYDVDDWSMNSRAEICAMVESGGHQGLVERGCCHLLGPAVVTVTGDDAVAVCESVLLVRRSDGRGYSVARAGANHFRLRREDGRWQIVQRRTTVLDGTERARALLAAGVAGRVP
ncbi:nuclear transport factor 2 family protein [Mycolicibacterium mengxianglii]|uniref:nuclear transport factor 2 family protein n=1 Tax=Mycolicibacterium mengxianglii TaxID=2736649 RepID=UPI0018EED813|nr:nuclear transport factor 2 family protein [Mycolicibacterium mengxianglii]